MMRNLFLFLIVFYPFICFSQEINVSGSVKSLHQGFLPGVDVIEKGTTNGTTTGPEGIYSIKVKSDAILIFSSIGFKAQEIAVNGKAIINVVLQENHSRLNEVVVKGFTTMIGRARKRLESIQRIPESITGITAKQINITGIHNIGNLLNQIPGIAYGASQDPGTVMISVRGIPQIRYGPSPIAIIVDGVYLPSPDLTTAPLYDIDQIEVIKGSEGLFYGKNAIGGAIVITTKQPTNGLNGHVKVGYGNGNSKLVQGVISGSIVNNKSYYRIGVTYHKFGGLIENTFLHKKVDFKNDFNTRGELKFRLGSKSTLSFAEQYENKRDGAMDYISSALNADFPGMSPNVYKGTPQEDDLGKGSVKSSITSASFETNFNGSRLTSNTSYTNVKLNYTGDYISLSPVDNYGPRPIATQAMLRASRTFDEALRLVSTKHSKFQWTLGLFYQNINSNWNTEEYLNKDTTDFTYAHTTLIRLTEAHNSLSSLGLFGFFEYHITDKFNISAGLRNEWEALGNHDIISSSHNKNSYSAFQPEISTSYSFVKGKMLYASFSRGFRSGGFNPVNVPSIGIAKIIKPEFANSFQVGAKTSFWNRRFILNLDYFYTIYVNQQVYRWTYASNRTILGTVNYAQSKIRGFEANAKLRLSKYLDLTGGVSFIHSRITKAFDVTSIGNKVPFAPQSSFNIGIFPHFNLGKKSKLLASIDIENKGKKYWFADNLYGIKQSNVFQEPYTLVNAKVICEFNNFSIGVWGKNIFNVKYNEEWWPMGVFDGNPYGGPIGDIRSPSEPATYGLQLSYKF